jgi:hypothetical protein
MDTKHEFKAAVLQKMIENIENSIKNGTPLGFGLDKTGFTPEEMLRQAKLMLAFQYNR